MEKVERISAPLPAPVGGKRRISSQDSVEGTPEDSKRIKLAPVNEIQPERRDSKDSGRSSGSSKRSSGERHVNSTEEFNANKIDKTPKEKKKQRTPVDANSIKEDLESEDDGHLQRQENKELKQAMSPDFGSSESLDEKGKCSKKEKRNSGEFRKDEIKKKKDGTRRRETNFLTGTESDGSDEEGKPKKHSIFDIVDDGPVYISMYDKVKARSTKNMQKQEEEKRQEKMKEKFSALKQSRAKREEKKRSTSYDEDSDSESGRGKNWRRKALVTSSSESSGSDTKLKKTNTVKKEDDSESDSRIKSTKMRDDNDGAARTKALLNSLARKGSRSRIVSDTSEDERMVNRKPKTSNIFTDDSEADMGFAELEDTQQYKNKSIAVAYSSDEERHRTHIDATKTKIFMDSLKLEKRVKQNHDSGAEDDATVEGTTPPPAMENCNYSGHSKDKDGVRKKSHKKKQKKQKSLQHREDPMDGDSEMPDKQDLANCVEKRKKHTSKKERRKSNHNKLLIDEEGKVDAKTKVRKLENNVKRDEKMEYIFGPLSEDSENSKPPTALNNSSETLSPTPRFDKMPPKWQVSQVYASDSDSAGPVEREAQAAQARSKRKEKKRRERKALDEAGKILEAKLLDDDHSAAPIVIKEEPKSAVANEFDVFQFTEGDESREAAVMAHKEKRKKRKKSKEEKQNRHHHHHHHHHRDREHAKVNSPDRKTSTSTPSPVEVKSDPDAPCSPPPPSMPSLPSLSPTPASSLSPATAKKVLIPYDDENIHETAVKSIEQQFSPRPLPQEEARALPKEEPRLDTKLVISQEETEDAVAALLEETFGGSSDDFGEPTEHNSSYDTEVVTEDADDETAQAVESLNLKPDTPQSEHDLQIDTDTDDAEADSSVDCSRPPKTPDIPASFYNRDEHAKPAATVPAASALPSEGLMERISDMALSSSRPSLPKLEPEEPVPVSLSPVAASSPVSAARLSSPKAASEVKPELFDKTPSLIQTTILAAPKAESATEIKSETKPVFKLDVKQPVIVRPPPQQVLQTVSKPVVAKVEVNHTPHHKSSTDLNLSPTKSTVIKGTVVAPMLAKPVPVVSAQHMNAIKAATTYPQIPTVVHTVRPGHPLQPVPTLIKSTVSPPVLVNCSAPKGAPVPQVPTQAVPKVVPKAVPQVVPKAVPQAVPLVTPQAVPHAAPQAVPHAAPQAVPHPVPQAVPHPVPQVVPQAMSHAVPHPVPQVVPQAMPHVVPQVVLPSKVQVVAQSVQSLPANKPLGATPNVLPNLPQVSPPSKPIVVQHGVPQGVPVPVVRAGVAVVAQPVITNRLGLPPAQHAVVNASPRPMSQQHMLSQQQPHVVGTVAPKLISPPGLRLQTPIPLSTPTSVITSSVVASAAAAALLTTVTPSTATLPLVTSTQALAGSKPTVGPPHPAHVMPVPQRLVAVNAVCGVRPSLPAQPAVRHLAPQQPLQLASPHIQPRPTTVPLAVPQPGVLAVNASFQPGPGKTPTLALPVEAARSPKRSPRSPRLERDSEGESEGALCIVEEDVKPAPAPAAVTAPAIGRPTLGPGQAQLKAHIKCDSPIDIKDESWSKEVNIDSVIKTLDASSKEEEVASRNHSTDKTWFDSRGAPTSTTTTSNAMANDLEKGSAWHLERSGEPERPWMAVKPMERAKSPSPCPTIIKDEVKVEPKPWPMDKEDSKAWLAATPVDREQHLAHLVANKDRDKIKPIPWLEAKVPDKAADVWLDKLSTEKATWVQHARTLTAEQERERWRAVTSPSVSPMSPQARSPSITAAESLEVSPLAKEFAVRSPNPAVAVSPLNRDKLEPLEAAKGADSCAEPAEEDAKKQSPGGGLAKSPEAKEDVELSDAQSDEDSHAKDANTKNRRNQRRTARRGVNTRAAAQLGAQTPSVAPASATTSPAASATSASPSQQGVTTRRGRQAEPSQVTTRRGRARTRGGNDSASRKLADVYEFRDDSDEDKEKDKTKEDAKTVEDVKTKDNPPAPVAAEVKDEPTAEVKKEDKDEKSGRPRLILTIKSPVVTAASTKVAVAIPAAPVVETREEAAAPAPTLVSSAPTSSTSTGTTTSTAATVATAASTRKSRRLQEKDGSRSTVDDVIDDVVRNVAVVTRSAAAETSSSTPVSTGPVNKLIPVAAASAPAPAVAAPAAPASPPPAATTTRRQTRQNRGLEPSTPEQPRKSPRASRKAAVSSVPSARRDSSSEDTKKPTEPRAASSSPARPTAAPQQTVVLPQLPPASSTDVVTVTPTLTTSSVPLSAVVTTTSTSTTTTKAPGKLSTRVLEKEKEKEREERERKRRSGGAVDEPAEPTMMICPETGVLIPMQEAEEGQYVPVPDAAKQSPIIVSKTILPSQTDSSATSWLGQTVPVKPLQTLKQHVLQQAVKQEIQKHAVVHQKPVVFSKPVQLAPQEQPKLVVSPMPGTPVTQIAQAAKVCVVQPDPKMNVNVVVGQPQKPQNMILKTVSSAAAVPLVTAVKPNTVPAAAAKLVTPVVAGSPAPVTVSGKPAVPVLTQAMNPKMHLLQAAAIQHQNTSVLPANLAKVNQVATVQASTSVNKPTTVTPMTPKSHILNAVNASKTSAPLGVALPQPVGVVVQPVSTSPAHLLTVASPTVVAGKPAPVPVKTNTLLSLVQPPKAHLIQQAQQPFAGAVASPPLHKTAVQQPVIAGTTSYRAALPVPQSKLQGDGVQHAYPPPHILRAAPPGVHDLSQHPHGTQYVHPVTYQYLRGLHGEGLLSYHLPSSTSATATVAPPPRSPIVPKIEPDLEDAAGRGAASAPTPGAGTAPPGISPPLELRRPGSSTVATVTHSLQSPHDRTTDSPLVATVYRLPHYAAPSRYYPAEEPPPAHVHAVATRAAALHSQPAPEAPISISGRPGLCEVATPALASQVPPQHDSLLMLLQRYPVMWQGLLALKNDQAAVQMHFVFGNPVVARGSLPCNGDGSTPPLRIAQRMRLEPTQIDGVTRKMQTENEHCMLLALPCGRDTMDVLQQSNNLQTAFITYLQQKQAAGIVNIAAPGSQQAAYVVHVFPSCEFANDSLARIAPDLFHRVANLAHLVIIIATV